ncbi:ATP-grasp domain-containing protein [Corynebacterium crudilactis]|uniref:ATP-grasp domain-containing protein n=1 Tax=Corynebacterium crudilactis TaxID=1652495 RepID=A0A172QQX3_9CORY|nr:ATP-grasp domain-containing protein [Corynebacterium crudilactis]ANE03078.1 hypothetical protein ccrud_01850 [Corynebacterium crudilactis]
MRNILLLSSGRRVELIQSFQRAFAKKSPNSKVVAADAQPLAPALYYADSSVVLPKISESGYKKELIKAIKERNIDLVIPTIDPELPVLAAAKTEIEEVTDAKVMIADPWVINICNDKELTHSHVTEKGLIAPDLYDTESELDDSNFPLILKPKSGSSSIGVNVVNSNEELQFLLPRTNDPMIQELISGEEYTADCFCDFDGKVISIVPRLRIATRGGEILKGKIVKDMEIINSVRSLLETLPMPGHSTVQCFKTERGIEFIEVNPRFGGGAPMSIAAGANSCERLIDLLAGKTLDYDEGYEDGLLFLRFDQSIVLREEQLKTGLKN